MGLYPPNFSNFDCERLLVSRFGWKRASRQNERNLVACLEILGTTDNLPFTDAISDPAHRQLVGVGMFVAGNDLGHDDTLEIASNLLDSFDFNPEERQTFREFLDGPIEVHILLEPIDRDFHELDSHQ